MRRQLRTTALAAAVLACAISGAFAAFPARTAYITDAANLLAPATARELERVLRETEAQARVEIAVVTVNALDGLTIESYARQLFRRWQLGNASRRGVLVLVAPRSREMRIEVGPPLEPILPDRLAMQVINDSMLPFFRKNDYDGGIRAGALRVADIARRNRVVRRTSNPVWNGLVLVAFIAALTFAPMCLGRAIERRTLPWALAAVAFAAIGYGTAPGGPASVLGWIAWGAAGVWAIGIFAIAMQWQAFSAQAEADRAKQKAEAEARWAAMKAKAADPTPQEAPEPEHWIFREHRPLADGWSDPARDRGDRDRDRNRDRGSTSGGSSSGRSGGATGRW